jgi:pimeloyl-ACP methyl ester carboxylesterase/predicted glycosyltransferase
LPDGGAFSPDGGGLLPPDSTLPHQYGAAHRGGVALAYGVYGSGTTTLLLLPTWPIVDTRFWKAQLPYLARHYRVIVFDARGSRRSGRPIGAAAYGNSENAADAVAVLDATGTERAVLVAYSCGADWAVRVAASHPDRVLGVFALSPSCGLAVAQPEREHFSWATPLDTTDGWAKYNKHYWLDGGLADFREFFFRRIFTDPHSTKQIEDMLSWSAEVPTQVVVDSTAARLGYDGIALEPLEPLCAKVRCPVAVVHGTEDHVRVSAIGERLAELTGASLTLLDGAGHGLMTRDPVKVNRMIRDFVDRICPPVARQRWQPARMRRKRVLYLSSPIGLGHVRRDLAIAAELRARHPGLVIDWLAQHPVTEVLAAEGETVHPASACLASESAHIEAQALVGGEHDLHAFQAIRRMDAILVNNFMAFLDVVDAEPYDLVIGDEAWDVDYFLHENPELKHYRFAWMTDFVGWLPMPDGGPTEALLTADYNAEMIEQRVRAKAVRDRSIFVGNPEDVVPDSFGPGLPSIREWTEKNFEFAGYISGFRPLDTTARQRLRSRLGYRPDDKVCVVTVGGSGVGGSLLQRVLDAVPLARRRAPDLRFLVVCGPRIDPASLPRRAGARIRGYLPRLYEHLAAADLAIVQGGLTTCMELTAAGTPFIYVPLEHHFEQNYHVRHRLNRYSAGRHLPYALACDPDLLADAIVAGLAAVPDYRPVETDGAQRAAGMLAELI